MDIRLITVKEDFEKAYNILNQREYPLSFYEYTLKHDLYTNKDQLKLVGVFNEEICIGSISYKVVQCLNLGRILEIKELYYSNIGAYKKLLDFLDEIAKDEECNTIKINKNKTERLNISIFDKFENYLKNLIH
jgi:hypothetical protein